MTLKPYGNFIEHTSNGSNQQTDETGTTDGDHEKDQDDATSSGVDEVENLSSEKDGDADSVLLAGIPSRKLSDWEARRYGSMAARLLRDVQIA